MNLQTVEFEGMFILYTTDPILSVESNLALSDTEEHLALSEHSGVMIALHIPDDIADKLIIKDGLSAEELHVTLIYLDKLGNKDALIEILSDFVKVHAPFIGNISGVGRFTEDEQDVLYASVDAFALPFLRQDLVEQLNAFDLPKEHGFTPHVTLKYIDADEESPVERIEDLALSFNALYLHWKGEVHEFKLTGTKRMIEALAEHAILLGSDKSGFHGHKGIPGHRGGSLPRVRGLGIQYGVLPETAYNNQHEDLAGVKLIEDQVLPGTEKAKELNYLYEGTWGEQQVAHTKATAAYLAEKYGLNEQQVEETISAWTSGPNNPNSAMVSLVVAELYGAPITDSYKARKLDNINSGIRTEHSSVEDRDITIHPLSEPDAKRIVQAMYSETQERLEAAGISHLHLQRGVRVGVGQDFSPGDIVPIQLNPVSSWTVSNGLAETFAVFGSRGYPGAILASDVPRQRILSFPGTGIGSFSEGEFIVIGGSNDTSYVYRTYEK